MLPVGFLALLVGLGFYGVETLDGEDLRRRFRLKLRERRGGGDRVFSQSGPGTWLRWLVCRTLYRVRTSSYRFRSVPSCTESEAGLLVRYLRKKPTGARNVVVGLITIMLQAVIWSSASQYIRIIRLLFVRLYRRSLVVTGGHCGRSCQNTGSKIEKDIIKFVRHMSFGVHMQPNLILFFLI